MNGYVSKQQIVMTAPCPKCGAKRGIPCRITPAGEPKSHHDRLHLAQIMINAFRKAGEKIEQVKIVGDGQVSPPKRDDPEDFEVIENCKDQGNAKTTLTYGSPVTPDHREIDPRTGMQKEYVVLAEEERAKGFVEPVRLFYRHLACGCLTSMGKDIAETYARDPFFYSATFCAHCGAHFRVGEDGEFVWADGTNQKVGTRAARSDADHG